MTKTAFRGQEDPTCCAQRWILAYMGLWLGITAYMFNSNMSIAAVCMVKTGDESSTSSNTTFLNGVNTSTLSHDTDSLKIENASYITKHETERCGDTEEENPYMSKIAEFSWDKKTRSFVLSSYFYGYMVTQVPGGWLTTVYGGNRVVGTSMALSSVLTLLMPVFARTSVYLLMVARAVTGLSSGMVIPGYCGLVGVWALPTERGRFLALCWFGQMVGAVFGYTTSGLLCVHGFDNGWPSIFYVHGMIGVLFVVTWWYFIHSSPQNHPRISEKERQLLMEQSHTPTVQTKKVPWKKIFTYAPIYAMFVAHTCDNWTHYLILTCLPQFFKEVLKFNIQSNGLFSSLPFISLMVGIAFTGVCIDFIRKKNCFTVTTIRKIFQLTGLIGGAGFIIIPGFLTCDQAPIAILCLCLCTLFQGVSLTGGYTCNAIDIAPRYASVIFAVSNMIATIPGILAPLAVAEITQNQTSEEWRAVFYMCAGVSLFAALVYGVFSNSEQVSWAAIDTDKELEVADTHRQELEVEVTETHKPSVENSDLLSNGKERRLSTSEL